MPVNRAPLWGPFHFRGKMTNFTEELRHYCRNTRCRSRLPAPVANPREAFCTRGCHGAFYRSRCVVCEDPTERKTERQRVCRKSKCRNAFRVRSGFGRYLASKNAGDGEPAFRVRARKIAEVYDGSGNEVRERENQAIHTGSGGQAKAATPRAGRRERRGSRLRWPASVRRWACRRRMAMVPSHGARWPRTRRPASRSLPRSFSGSRSTLT